MVRGIVRVLLIVLCAMAVWAPLRAAGVYRWVDEHGQVQYSDTPPAKGAQRVEVPQPSPEQDRAARERLAANITALLGPEVFGAVELRVMPRLGAGPPAGTVVLSLGFSSGEPGGETMIKLDPVFTAWSLASDGAAVARLEFATRMHKGTYRVVVGVDPGSLARSHVVLPSSAQFVVPEEGCFYAGRAEVTWVRLPRASFDESVKMMGRLGAESSLTSMLTYYSTEGMLVYAGTRWITPDPANPAGATAADLRLIDRAKARGCQVSVD